MASPEGPARATSSSEGSTEDSAKGPTEVRTGPAARVWVVNPARAGLLGWLFRYVAFALVGMGWVVVLSGVAAYRWFAADLPEVETIESYASIAPGVTQIYSADGAVLAQVAREHRSYARYEDVPEPLVQAFLAAEDRRFFEHGGLDHRGLARALLANLRSGTIRQGGSTITQQVAKGFLTQEQTITRKIREAILSVRMESRLPKERILEVYLNKIFLGHGAYGVAAAASRYFGKPLPELTLAEHALIAGLARAPSRYSPLADPERAKERRGVVLQDMVEAGYITAAQRDAADAEPIVLAGDQPDPFRVRAPYYAEHVRQTVLETLGEEALLTQGLRIETPLELSLQARAAIEVDRALRRLDNRQGWRGPVAQLRREPARQELRRRLRQEYGDAVLDDELRWYLGIVTKVNKFNAWVDVGAKEAVLPLRHMAWASRYNRNSGVNELQLDDVRKALEEGDVIWVQRVSDPRGGPPDPERPELTMVLLGQLPRVEAALYTVDHQTGDVVVMQGGRDYDRSQFNRCTQACRQPGSVFKAIYYALALDSPRYGMDTILEDKPYEPEPGEVWDPQNLHGTLSGQVLLRNAFIHSLNLPSIRLFSKLGADEVVKWSRRLGFSTEFIADRALSLGASCVRIDELTRAFGVFVRGGRSWQPHAIRRVVDKRGVVVLDQRHPWDEGMDVAGRLDALGRLATEPPTQIVDARTAFLITKMMRDVVTSGIGRYATKIGVPAGGKSGTASKRQNTTDTWFVGFTARYVTAAWMGDDEYERSMGDEEASYTTATPMWTGFMEAIVEGIPHPDQLPVGKPEGVVSKVVEFETGMVKQSATLWFR
ncbi:penicillin-binding protein 1A [Paraliomyxa miuraensis]|uniref:penicillin-binding protein 1A n=1 Tax=Paraliomyxa miuraensis TaxID=376150 RepID=UPI0022539866|nr:PBP1A family penicillin-binding protein [Paraliomyxa miuraensis]